MLDESGEASSRFREKLHDQSFKTSRKYSISRIDITNFFTTTLKFIDHTIDANRRIDGLLHAYNLMTADKDSITIAYLYEMLEGQVAALSSGYLNAEEALSVLKALRKSSIYTSRQNTYLLYPDRELTRFTEKNCIPQEAIKKSVLLTTLLDRNDHSVIEPDEFGGYHFKAALIMLIVLNGFIFSNTWIW